MLGLALALVLATPVTYVVDPAQSPVEFLAIGKPGFLRIHGKDAHLEGAAVVDEGRVTGTFAVALGGMTTGIALRDRHMRETYLEVDKHPKATVRIEPTPISLERTATYEVPGVLSLHGTEQPIRATVRLEPAEDGRTVRGEATFPVAIEAHGIDVPRYMGVTVADKVEVTARFVATRP